MENRSILASYKTMISKNIGEAYSKLFSDRLGKMGKSGYYTTGKELSRQMRNVMEQYQLDLADEAKLYTAL